MAGEPNSSFLRSPMDIEDRPELLEVPMDQKENACVVPEDNLSMLPFPSETRMKKKRNIRGKGFNLRKSLAWNQAFFTEEGVLNPMELSVLGTSSTKSSGNLLSISEMSPSTSHSKCSIRPPLQDLEANRYLKVHSNSHKKAIRPRNLFSSINGEAEAHVVSLKTPSGKGISRNIPRSASSSQKRVSNASTTNPTSKLPKSMSTKTHAASLSSASSTVMLTTERSKFEQTIPKVNGGRNVGLRAQITKRISGYASSLPKLSAADHERKTNSQFKSGPANSKIIPKHLSSAKLNEAVTCGTTKAASSLSQGISNACGGPAPVHARPSALRMPSPSLGFFCQGKASPSYNNPSQRYAQPSETKMPYLGKPMYLRRESELRPLTSNRQPTKSAAAINFGARVGISSISGSMAGNRLKRPSATPETQLSVEVNEEMKQADFLEQRPFVVLGDSRCEKDDHELSTSGNLLAGNSVDEQPQVLSSGKCYPDGMEVQNDDSSSNIINDSFGKGSHQLVKPNPFENAQGAYLSTIVFEGSSCPNISSQICFTKELKECEPKEIQEGDFVVDNLAEQSHASATRDEIHSLTTESKRSAGNSEIVSNIGFVFPTRTTTRATPLEAKTSFSQGVDEMAYACPNNDEQVNNYLAQTPLKYLQTALPGSICVTNGLDSAVLEELEPGSICVTNGLGSALLEELEHPQLEDSNYLCGVPQCQSAEVSSLTKEDTLMPGKNISTGKLKQVQLNGVQLDDSLTPSSSNSLQTTLSGSRTSEPINALSEELEPPHLEDTEYQCSGTPCESMKNISSTKDNVSMPRDSIRVGKAKQEVQLRPFSDEWLAAVEAFGEDILEKQTGPVQHSPPDKSLPEPNPWSPVKRKAQDIGPYDCTKYSKNSSTISDNTL